MEQSLLTSAMNYGLPCIILFAIGIVGYRVFPKIYEDMKQRDNEKFEFIKEDVCNIVKAVSDNMAIVSINMANISSKVDNMETDVKDIKDDIKCIKTKIGIEKEKDN